MGVATNYLPAPKRFWLHWHLPIRAHVGVNVDFTPTWYEIDNRPLVWTLSNAPAWMSIDASTGRITGAPSSEATHADIVLTGTRDDTTTITATFTCKVQNNLFVFVSPSGNDANAGTLASPKATINGALALVDNTAGKTVYVRGGTYTDGYIATGGGYDSTANWFSGKDRTSSDFHELRGYPGETVTLKFTTGGLGGPALAGKGCVVSHLTMGEGTRVNWPNALIVSASQTLVADCIFYNTDGTDNLAGLQIKPAAMASNDEVVFNRVVAYNNYNRTDPTNNNSTNVLLFTDVGDKASGNYIWGINSKAWGSVNGFKLKTSGSCGLVLQGCEGSLNTFSGFTVGKCLVNYCVALNNAGQDIKSSSDNNTDAPCYWANMTVANTSLKSTYYYANNVQSGAAASSIYERCIFAVLANTSAPIQRLWEYEADWTGKNITFQNNVYYGSNSTPMLAGGSSPSGRMSFAQWKAKSGGNVLLDTTGSVFSDPLFVNAAGGRLDVPSQSPAASFSGFFAGAFQPGKTLSGALGQANTTLVNFAINGNIAVPVDPTPPPSIVYAQYERMFNAPNTIYQAQQALAVTKSDTTTLPVTRALWVGGAGNIALLLMGDSDPVVFTVAAGTLLPFHVKKVMETSTTATNIVALY